MNIDNLIAIAKNHLPSEITVATYKRSEYKTVAIIHDTDKIISQITLHEQPSYMDFQVLHVVSEKYLMNISEECLSDSAFVERLKEFMLFLE